MHFSGNTLPGAGLTIEKMPGHWLLAQLGKRVLRPGGIELTRQMLAALDISRADHVIEFAPGLGTTARLTLAKEPASYTGVEADEAAARQTQHYLSQVTHRCVVGRAEKTELPDHSASVVYGEAMLTMQPSSGKAKIVAEAARLLQAGGRYGIHELCLIPDNLDDAIKQEISQQLSAAIHVGARPLTVLEWKALLEEHGYRIRASAIAPMHLLELPRMIQDEGLAGTARIALNILRTPAARKRVLAMRRMFHQYARYLGAVMLVAEKN